MKAHKSHLIATSLGLSKLLLAAATLNSAETLTLFDGSQTKAATNWAATGAAQVRLTTSGTIQVALSPGEDAAAFFNMPREGSRFTGLVPSTVYDKGFDFFKVASEACIWAGYRELVIECHNDESQAFSVEVLIEDLAAAVIGLYPKKERWRTEKATPEEVRRLQATHRGQWFVAAKMLKPGANTVRIPLDETLWSADGRRALNLHEIWSVGLRQQESGDTRSPVSPRAARRTVGITKIWLDGGTPGQTGLAGMWAAGTHKCEGRDYPMDWYRKLGTFGFSDPNAPFCPFCGRRRQNFHKEPSEIKGASRIYPSADAKVQVDSGGGTPVLERNNNGSQMGLARYPENTWDARAFLRFTLDSIPEGAKVKSAHIRFFHMEPHRPQRNVVVLDGVPTFYKPWAPTLQIFEVADAHSGWDEGKVNWLTQPPMGRMLVHGGLYNNVDVVTWFSYDLTSYVRQRLKAGSRSVNLGLKLMSPQPVFRGNIHYRGHHITFVTRESEERQRCTHLYIELDP